jgi:uncharacterized membrane-anchored protein YitT (DUF2179 family)
MPENPYFSSFSKITSMASFDDQAMMFAQNIAIFISKFLNAIRDFAVNTLFASAPLLIFMGSILGFSFYKKHFFTLLFSLAMWPIFSSILQALAFAIYKEQTDADLLSKSANLVLYSVIQGALPFITLSQAVHAAGSLKNIGGLGNSAHGIATQLGSKKIENFMKKGSK